MSEEAQKTQADLTDHEYDGIQEYDNPMPRWWVLIFWGSFYFAFSYFMWFHVYFKGSVKEDYAADMTAYREEMAKKALGANVTEEALEKLTKDPAMMADAQGIFQKRCVQCHAANGQGLIGPNLTDDFWIHGKGTLMDIYGVVNGGVPAKGMPEWGKQLSAIEVAKAAAYVGTLRGKHLPGKAPEGTQITAANR
ncbi:MAG TPA: cbb3-type cytochrome c oxidase N-terminal domain-containing protein [Polyangiaceae bacterium]|nr:cbb3-type cytochrome c oxidase N-terminal domain-containing protein [Polyangiaceae bacterium]